MTSIYSWCSYLVLGLPGLVLAEHELDTYQKVVIFIRITQEITHLLGTLGELEQ